MKRPICQICQSSKWRRKKAEGGLICSNGHVLEGYQIERDDDQGTGAGRTRRKNAAEKNIKEKPTVFHGNKGRFLSFACFQEILQKQVQDLTLLWKLSKEFELVVRDLWTVYMNSAKLVSLQMDDSSTSIDKGKQTRDDIEEMELFFDNDDDAESSQDENIGHLPALSITNNTQDKLSSYLTKHISLHYSIVLLYLACLKLTIPILLMDIWNAVQDGHLLFFGAISFLPAELISRIDISTHLHWVENGTLPTARKLGLSVQAFVNFYASFGIDFPPCLISHTVFRHLRDLILPVSIYPLVKNLLLFAEDDLRIKSQIKQRNSEREFMPEVRCAAAILIVLKMIYGFDGLDRRVESNGLSHYLHLPNMKDLMNIMKERLKEVHREPGDINDLINMKDFEIDAFIDRCQRALIPSNEIARQTVSNVLKPELNENTEVAKDPNRFLMDAYGKDSSVHTYLPSNEAPPPGNSYLHLPTRKIDIIQWDLNAHGVWSFWLECTAKQVGLSVSHMARSVSKLESKLKKKQHAL